MIDATIILGGPGCQLSDQIATFTGLNFPHAGQIQIIKSGDALNLLCMQYQHLKGANRGFSGLND